jgi:ABC-type branched-subunit amino acid transport system permease subunit
MTAIQMFAIGIAWLAGANGLFLLFSPILAPRLFVRYSDLGLRTTWSSHMPWWRMPFGLFGMLSLGRVIYCALYAVTFVIPPDWGSPDEDGDWQSYRHWVAFTLAFVATIPVLAALDTTARALVDRDTP